MTAKTKRYVANGHMFERQFQRGRFIWVEVCAYWDFLKSPAPRGDVITVMF